MELADSIQNPKSEIQDLAEGRKEDFELRAREAHPARSEFGLPLAFELLSPDHYIPRTLRAERRTAVPVVVHAR